MIDAAAIRIADRSNVAEARRIAREHAHALGWSDGACGDGEIVATELATNLVKHARDGVIGVSSRLHGRDGVLTLLAVDQGPGIGDPSLARTDGYSTSGTAGTGLGAVTRLAQTTDIATGAGGTVVVAELSRPVRDAAAPAAPDASRSGSLRPNEFQVAGFALAKEGQVINGDAWACRSFGRSLAVLVCDGLGHGPEAARASRQAVATFLAETWSTPKEALAILDEALRPTRGGAAAVGMIDPERQAVKFCGVGNIVAGVVIDAKARHMVSQNGILGAGVRKMSEFDYLWAPNATLLMHSDGVSGRWQTERMPDIWSRHPALVAGAFYRDLGRGNDDVAVVAVQRAAPA